MYNDCVKKEWWAQNVCLTFTERLCIICIFSGAVWLPSKACCSVRRCPIFQQHTSSRCMSCPVCPSSFPLLPFFKVRKPKCLLTSNEQRHGGNSIIASTIPSFVTCTVNHIQLISVSRGSSKERYAWARPIFTVVPKTHLFIIALHSGQHRDTFETDDSVVCLTFANGKIFFRLPLRIFWYLRWSLAPFCWIHLYLILVKNSRKQTKNFV